MRVLLVEDNRDTLATLAALLRYENKYDVATAHDALLALEISKVFQPDVALLDIGLPGMDGYALAQALRQQNPDRKVLIAAITGYGKAEDKKRAAEAGIDVHLTKPTHPSAIVELLEEFRSKL